MNIKELQSWLSGEQLASNFFRKQYGLLALIACMLFVYILAGYNSMKQQRHLSDIKREVKMAKYEYLTISAQLAEQTRQSKIIDKIEETSGETERQRGDCLQENRKPVIQIREH